jgi:hypothetical protein
MPSAVALWPSAVGDNAKGARVGAAVHHGHERGHQLPAQVARQQQIAVHDGEAALGFRVVQGFGFVLGQVRDERPGVRRRREHIHEGEALLEVLVPTHADQTAHQVDDHLGPTLLEGAQRHQPAISFVFRALAHGARVEHHHVGLFGARGLRVAQPFQRRGHAVGIGNVHLTTNGPNVIAHVSFPKVVKSPH